MLIAVLRVEDGSKSERIVSSSNRVLGAPSFSPYQTPELKAPSKKPKMSQNAQIPPAKPME